MVQVEAISEHELEFCLPLLEGFLRGYEPLPEDFVQVVIEEVERGGLVVFGAFAADRSKAVGVLTMALRPSFAIGGRFASIEDLFVLPGCRGRGVGRALVEKAGALCAEKGVSYVEVQAEAGGAEGFYGALGYGVEGDVRVMSRSQPVGFSVGSSRTS